MNSEQPDRPQQPPTTAEPGPHGAPAAPPAPAVESSFAYDYNTFASNQTLGLLAWNNPALWYHGGAQPSGNG